MGDRAGAARGVRHPGDRAFAYDNRLLGIGHGQTISAAIDRRADGDLLDLTPKTGCWRSAPAAAISSAVLAELAKEVFSLELVPERRRRRSSGRIASATGACASARATVSPAGRRKRRSMRSSSPRALPNCRRAAAATGGGRPPRHPDRPARR
ncbi:MAG: hypothetical protein U1E38_00590 [Rhodospirillales bacterium]